MRYYDRHRSRRSETWRRADLGVRGLGIDQESGQGNWPPGMVFMPVAQSQGVGSSSRCGSRARRRSSSSTSDLGALQEGGVTERREWSGWTWPPTTARGAEVRLLGQLARAPASGVEAGVCDRLEMTGYRRGRREAGTGRLNGAGYTGIWVSRVAPVGLWSFAWSLIEQISHYLEHLRAAVAEPLPRRSGLSRGE